MEAMHGSRPPSIVRFEQCYLASFAVGLIGWGTTWQSTAARLAADPRTAVFGWILPLALLLSVTISLGLWFLVARRGSVIAKWIVTVLTVLAVLRFLFNLSAAVDGAVSAGAMALSVVALLLSVAATICLFRANARWWFGEFTDEEDEA